MRRRPLMRAAVVGGGAYVAGKHVARNQQHEADQDAQLAQPEQPAAVPEARATSEPDRLRSLDKLKGMLDSGVLTQAEFDAEKQKVLQGP